MTTSQAFAAIAARLSLVLPILPTLPGQERTHDVPPGREIAEQKLLTPGLTDHWKLNVTADEMLWCTVTSDTFDPVLEIVDADGKVLGTNDGEGTRSELWLRMPNTGPIEVLVRPYQGSGGGRYRLWLQRFRTEPLGPSDERSGTFGEEQWWHYRVALREGDVLVPTVGGGAALTLVMAADRRVLTPRSGGYVAPRDGDYFLRLEGRPEARWTISTQLARRRDGVPDRVFDETMGSYGFDLWKLRFTRGTVFAVDVRMPQTQLEVDLIDLEPSEQGPRFRRCTDLDKGGQLLRYYHVTRDAELELSLRNHSGSAADYRLAIGTFPTELALGAAWQGELPRNRGLLYRLRAQSGQMLHIWASSEHVDTQFAVFGVGGEPLLAVDDSGPLQRDASGMLLVTRSGDHTLLLHGQGGGACSLLVESVPIPRLDPGERRSLQLRASEAQHFQVPLRAGQEIWLAVRGKDLDPLLTIIDPVGNDGYSASRQTAEGPLLAVYRASHDGLHTLRLTDRCGNGGDCELRTILP
ncbi:MAG: hypothetical protein AB7I19_17790 [Planctomycetota bacterium]